MSVGSSIIGIHHASRMFPSIAPTRIAILSPSPVFVSTATVCVHGPRRNARLSSSLCSKPPVAITTLGARTSLRPSGVSNTTPATSPSSMISSTPRWLGLRLDAAVEAGLQQPAAERESHAALVVGGPALHLLGGELLRDRLAERRLADREVVARVVRRDVDAVGPLAELAVGEDRRLERPAALGHAAGLLGVVVGEIGDGPELDGRALVQPADHLGADVDVGLGHLVGDRVVGQRAEVLERLLARVALLRRLVLVERDPDHPAGVDRRAADRRALLEQADLRAQFGRGHGGRQSGSARAQHDHVVVAHSLSSRSTRKIELTSDRDKL